jgi:hypothetical protein
MPTGDYYREQARLLMRWAASATDREIAQRLSYRAHDMLQLANETATATAVRNEDAQETLNAAMLRQGSSPRIR